MDRYAILVDAGYLFAQGSALVTGKSQKRKDCSLDEKSAIAELTAVAKRAVGPLPLLRIYWYDGSNRWPTAEQAILADADQVKLRLGFINSFGQQKGVDSLIITDLIDLARNHAICDAVVVSGDEDIRVGVQVAQALGVKVHLIGIEPAAHSQSKTLRQESDTTHEMDKASIAKFLTCRLPVPPVAEIQPAAAAAVAPSKAGAKSLLESAGAKDRAGRISASIRHAV